MVGLIVMLLGFAFFVRDLPSPDKIVRREGFATKIFDRNNKLLYDVFSDEQRTPVDLSAVSMSVRQATVAIEDKDFYKHGGLDPLTPFRIVWNILTKHRMVGGSTLTQQLVKNVLLTPERTIIRKLKEFILTIQVERKYTKDQILQMYLNEAPYGGTAWGIESAAQMYFGKSASGLSLNESAILAGLPQSPTQYSPYTGKLYINRAGDVLRRMREDGYITREQELNAKKDLPNVQFASGSGQLKAPHFVFYVKQQLVNRYGENVVEQGGLRVTTTLDLDLQDAAQKAVSEEIDKVKYLKITNGAAVAIDPKTGQILAMVGSRSWDDPNYDGKFNVATQGIRQPGSSIKPVVYLAGLRKGYTASTNFMDVKTSFPGGDKPEYVPENYDGKFRGPILMREALGNSINVPAVKMLALAGISDTLKIAYDMGLTTLEPTKDNLSRLGLSMALGGGEVKLLDMVSAYSAFANGGKKIDPVAILKVTDKDGRVLEEWKDTVHKQVITSEEAYIISSILSDPNARSITFGPNSAINISGKTIAVKTGTTNDKRDNWTVGWTPSIVTGVWVGNNDNSPMKEVASGVTGAAPIWKRIILAALNKKSDEPFPRPDGIIEIDVDKVSGYRAHDGFDSKKEVFIKGTEPGSDDPIHKKVRMCSGDEQEYYFFKEDDPFIGTDNVNKWQQGIDDWLKDQAEPKYHPASDLGCGNQVWITIIEPSDKSRINSNDVKIKVDVTSPDPIKQMEFFVDGASKQILTSTPWEVTVHMINGAHSIDIKATDTHDRVGTRNARVGINQDWDASPSPSPSPTP